MESTWIDILTQIITVVGGILIAGIGTVGGFYMKRFSDKLKKKTLLDEINRYVQWAEGAGSFKLMSGIEKKESVLERIRDFAIENDIKVSESELSLMVEQSVQSLKKLEMVGIRLTNLKKAERKKEAIK